MKITEALKSLENSWSRDEILVKIKNGANSEKIVNDFFTTKQKTMKNILKNYVYLIIMPLITLFFLLNHLRL